MISIQYQTEDRLTGDGREELALIRLLLSLRPHLREELGLEAEPVTANIAHAAQTFEYQEPLEDSEDVRETNAAEAFAPRTSPAFIPVTGGGGGGGGGGGRATVSHEEFGEAVAAFGTPAPAPLVTATNPHGLATNPHGLATNPGTPAATPAPAPLVTATNPHGLVDHKGTPYHVDFHSDPPKINTNGKWRAKRGVTAEAPDAQPAATPTPVAPPPPAATSAPSAPPAAVAPPPPTTAVPSDTPVTFREVMDLNKELTAAGKLGPGEIMIICKESLGVDLGSVMTNPDQLTVIKALLQARA